MKIVIYSIVIVWAILIGLACAVADSVVPADAPVVQR